MRAGVLQSMMAGLLLCALAALWLTHRSVSGELSQLGADCLRTRSRVQAIHARLDDMERDLCAMRLAAETAARADGGDRSGLGNGGTHPTEAKGAGSEGPLKELLARVTALESSVGELDEKANEVESQLTQELDKLTNPAPPPDIETLQAAVLDSSRGARMRVDALRDLRNASPDARTPAVAESMIRLADASDDPSLRADVFRHLHGAVPLAMKEVLIRRLSSDDAPQVREKVAECLGSLKSDASVVAALRNAADRDPDPKVRRKAERSLEEEKR